MTVVVGDLGGGGADVLATTQAWAARGLLRDSYWVDRDDGFDQAHFVSESGATEKVELLPALVDRTDLARLMIVALHAVGSVEEAEQAPTGRQDHERVQGLFTRAAVSGIDVLTLNLIVLATDVPFPTQAYDEAWHATLVVATEDRFADDQIPADIPASELGPHAAGAIATATGMWSGAIDSPLDEVDATLRQHGRGSVRVVRTTTRFVDGGPLPDSIIDRVLTLDGTWPAPDGTTPVPADEVVPDAVSAIVSRHDLTYTPLTPPPAPPPRYLGWREGLRLFFTTMGATLEEMPADAVRVAREEAARSIARRIQSATFGLGADVVVTVDGQAADGRARGTAEEEHRWIRRLGLPGAEDPQPEPDLWRDVRSVACAIIDGAEYPDPLPSPRRKRSRKVVLDPDHVVPTPFGSGATFAAPELGAGRVVRPSDPRGADELREVLLPRAAEEAEVGTGDGPSVTRLETLNRWVEERTATFTWGIGTALSAAATAARRELDDAFAALAGDPPSLDDSPQDRVLRRRLRQVTITSAATIVLALTTSAVALLMGWWSPGRAALVTAVVFTLATVIAASTYLGIARQLVRSEHRRQQALHHWLFARTRAVHAGLATTRFCSLYWQHLDWSEIIGGVAHRPWGQRRGDPLSHRLSDVRTARSTLLATADPDLERMLHAVALGQRAVATTGWLTTHLLTLEELSTTRYARTTATPIDQVQPTFDTAEPGVVLRRNIDTNDDVRTPRGNLHRDVVLERFADQLREGQSQRVIDASFSLTPDQLLGPVEVHGVGQALSGEPVSEFLADVKATDRKVSFPFSMFVDASLGVRPERSVVRVPRGVERSDSWGRTLTRTEPGRNLLLMACRLDLSDGLEPSDLVATSSEAADEADADGRLGDAPRPRI